MINAIESAAAMVRSNHVRLDEIDTSIIRELVHDARIPNNALAEKVGIAPSTALARMRALRESGVIKGFHADIDLEMLGLEISAMVSVLIHSHARSRMTEIAERISKLDSVQRVFLISGDRDLLVHISCESPSRLRDFVSTHLNDPAIANTQTNLIFSELQHHH
ncbi:AsnC family transcriptional regulator [Rhodococcus sp. SRB_17]|uniref:Lrp/AsnC family transcriptional regulator n=1 Tax=unclassified Rhodococcus (in: high G+C Gram-positive bacteria) TaxID=192944 RepID=UPI000B940A13|nr:MULTISPECIES: Lrp/AsnC family transcriptional regulator [unclassified Rhodococcus (in: high G+C Gram-positive bacteria)]MDI9913952.1 Lrp/AsnC family transcriptional regulator [Rhodococcus sp. IEGM 1379]NMM85473.1 AsnC family transcriptional regulator [Rhodococcus sp. SRB_17]OYD67114.1 DNA-binding Lrp family transcriptional regulator [Rhodococcus sp. OK302]